MRSYIISSMIILAVILFGFGLFLPLLTVEKFYVFNDTITLYSSVVQLFQSKEFFLFSLIFIFSIIFPIIKLLSLTIIWFVVSSREKALAFLNILGRLGKWSMLDVFVVALFLVTVKLGAIATVHVHQGVYAFACSVILTKLTIWYMQRALSSR